MAWKQVNLIRCAKALALECLALCNLGGFALADPPPIVVIDNLADFKNDSSHALTVVLQSFATVGDGGGGTFSKKTTSTCLHDDGVVVLTSGGGNDCYYRQFSGPVHLSWYGVGDATSPACLTSTGFTCDAAAAVVAAFNAAKVSAGFGGDGGVTTDGRSIALLSHCGSCSDTANAAFEIPSDQYLTCDAPPGVTRGQSGTSAEPYYTLPHSLVLDPQFTIKRDGHSRFSSCLIRPTWYYPQSTDDGAPFNIPARNVRDTVNIVRQFRGTATTCAGKACNMDNMLIIGFDTSDDTSGANKAIIKDVVEGGLVNEWLHNNGAGTKLQNFFGGPWIESGFGDAQFDLWNITNVQQDGTDAVKVAINMSGHSTANIPAVDDTILISGLGQGTVAPVSANGRWLVTAVNPDGSDYDVTLKGASWAGPTYTGTIWKTGVPVLGVYATTNIIAGQYVCSTTNPSNAPFCTPPAGFASAAVMGSNLASLGGSSTGSVTVSGSLAGWPLSGLVLVDSENMRYTILNANTLTIAERGANGTAHNSHANNTTMTPAAPVVVGVIPTPVTPLLIGTALEEAVIVSAPASGTASGSVVFANDTSHFGAGTLGNFALNPSYHTWTANAAAGSNPSGTLTIYAGATGTTITPGANCFKIQPNMSVYDITASASLPSVTHVDCTANQVTVGGAVSFSNHQIRFSGCGYPGFPDVDIGYPQQPWLGNCAATSVLLGKAGDPDTGDGPDQDQGTVCEYVHVTASEIGLHTLDAPANNCVNLLLVDNGPTGPQADPGSVALWLDGHATKSQFSNGRIAFFNSILDTPSGAGQPDGVGISNIQIGGNLILGAETNIGMSLLHGQLNPPATGFVFAPAAIEAAHIDSTQLPQWSVYVDDLAALAKLYCAANFFANAPCTQVKGTPTCVSNCGGVTGSDGNFDVTVSGLGVSPTTIQLSAAYAAAPICSISAGTMSAGAVASASVSAVTWQPWGTTLSIKVSGPPVHVYGACRGATG